MKKCKWAGDAGDEYCKSCDGITMMVDGLSKSCKECAGYEEGTEEVEDSFSEDMNEPEVPFEEEEKKPAKKPSKSANTANNKAKTTNSTSNKEKAVESPKNKLEKVSEEKYVEETKEAKPDGIGIQVTSLRYTSSVTVKKGDNYYKFTAEEEWSTALYNGDIQDVREQLWAKLNSEVDKQIEDLQNM